MGDIKCPSCEHSHSPKAWIEGGCICQHCGWNPRMSVKAAREARKTTRGWKKINLAPTDGTFVYLMKKDWVCPGVGAYNKRHQDWRNEEGHAYNSPTHYMDIAPFEEEE